MRKKLQPVFVTDFSRNSRMLSWQGAEIELCMDQGEISTEHLGPYLRAGTGIDLRRTTATVRAVFEHQYDIAKCSSIIPARNTCSIKNAQLDAFISKPTRGIAPWKNP